MTAETDDHHSDPGGVKLGSDSIIIGLEEVKTRKAKKKARTEKESKKKKKLRGTFEDDDIIEELSGTRKTEKTLSVNEEDNKLSTSLGGIQQGDEGLWSPA